MGDRGEGGAADVLAFQVFQAGSAFTLEKDIYLLVEPTG